MPTKCYVRTRMKTVLLSTLAATASGASVLGVLEGNPDYSTLATLAKAVPAVSTLLDSAAGPMTLFAPTNEAFAKLPDYLTSFLTDPKNTQQLTRVLQYHLVYGAANSCASLTDNEELTTSLPDHAKIHVRFEGSQKLVADGSDCELAPISKCDMAASNGVVHGIDEMLLPTATVCPDSLVWAAQRNGMIGYNRVRCNGMPLNVTKLLAMNQTKPVGLSVDAQYEETKYVMWSNDQNYQPYDSWISAKNVQTNDTQIIFPSKLYDPQGLVIDDVFPNPRLYFTEHLGNRVSRSALVPAPGSHLSRDPVITFNTSLYPADVKVDTKKGLVFVAVENGPNDPGCCGFIMAMNISDAPLVPNPTTHQLENVHILVDSLAHPYGMCIDQTNQHLFYIVGGEFSFLLCVVLSTYQRS